MEKSIVTRKFIFKGKVLDDPNPHLSIEEVKRHYSTVYPEITTASVEGPKYKGGSHEYTFKTSVGTLG